MGLLDKLKRMLGGGQPAADPVAATALPELEDWLEQQLTDHAAPEEVSEAVLGEVCLTHMKVLQLQEALSGSGQLMLFGRVVPEQHAAAVRERFAPRVEALVERWHQRLVVPLLEELRPWLEARLEEHRPPAQVANLDDAALASALRPLLDASHELEQEGAVMVFGRVVPGPVRERLQEDFAEPLKALVLAWQEALTAVHGEPGRSFVAELAAQCYIGWVPGEQRGARYRLTLAVQPTLESVEEWVQHGLSTGQLGVQREGDRVVAARISVEDEDDDPDRLLDRFLASLEPDQLRRLTLGLWREPGEVSYESAVLILERSDKLGALEALFLGDFEFPEETEISWTQIGAVGALLDRLPALRELRLRGGGIALGELRHPVLERLTIETGGLPAAAVRSIVSGQLPALRSLMVWFGAEDYGAEADLELLRPLFSHDGYPALRQLGLMNAEFSDGIAAALGEARFLEQLEVLDLSLGTLTDRGARALAELKDRLAGLRELRVGDNYLGERGEQLLGEAFGERVIIGEQEEPDEDTLYVSVGE